MSSFALISAWRISHFTPELPLASVEQHRFAPVRHLSHSMSAATVRACQQHTQVGPATRMVSVTNNTGGSVSCTFPSPRPKEIASL